MAADIVKERWSTVFGFGHLDLDAQFIGLNACRPWHRPADDDPPEVRLRLTVRAPERDPAVTLAEEVEALYTNGPAGGGGVVTRVEETLAIVSTLIPRDEVAPQVEVLG